MASRSTRNGQQSNPDQVKVMREWIDLAREHGNPEPSAEEREKVPQTLAFLAPEVIPDPDHRGESKAKKVLREPLLMISWDRAAGRWKWAISDKVCRVQVGGHFDTLIAFSEQIERQLAEKKVFVKELDPTRRKDDDS